jgi:hypothetical protein
MSDHKRKPKKLNPKQIPVPKKTDEGEQQTVSRAAIMPSVGAGLTIRNYSKKYGENATLEGLVQALREQVRLVQKGDLNRSEAMLIAQAHSLDAVFNELAQLAAINMKEHLNAADILLRLALKAQGQCRATLETLAEMKFPKSPTFVRQQNVGVNQQVNNSEPIPNIPRAPALEDFEISTNKLLEQDPNGWQHNGMDTGTTRETSGNHCELEAVGGLNRPSDQSR